MLDAYFRASTATLLAGALGAALAASLLRTHVPDALLLVWLTGIESVFLLRLISVHVYNRHTHGPQSLRRWNTFAMAATLLQGGLWGLFGFSVCLLDDMRMQSVVLVTVIVMCAGSAALVGALPRVVPIFGLLTLVPTALGLLCRPDAIQAFLAFACLMVVLTVSFVLPRTVQRLVKQVHAAGQARELVLMHLEDAEHMARIGHFVVDVQTGKTDLSAGARQLFGLEAADAMGLDAFAARIDPQDRARVRRLMATAQSDSTPDCRFETRLTCGSDLRHVEVIQRTCKDDSDAPSQVMVTLLDITAQKDIEHKLSTLAYGDPLTGLSNRAGFHRTLTDRLNAVQCASGPALALLLLDLDHFKSVNDTHGHAAGDRVLTETATRLQRTLGTRCPLARLGGDEFSVILDTITEANDAARVAQALIEALQDPFQFEGKEVYVSSSVGIALYPDDASQAETLLRCADIALFEAKSRGRSDYHFHSRELSERALERGQLEGDLRRAVERDELELHYQPKVHLSDARLTGAEALLRWRHPEMGLIPPDRFIPVAEDSGLIVPIGAWVLKTACATARVWNEERLPSSEPLKVAVNLSPRQFWCPGFLDTVRKTLDDTGCRPQWIELELTESLLIDSRGQVAETLEHLRDMGFTLAIDDFGTGYSALSYLTRFPIHTLKIDRSFVSDMTTQPARMSIVRAVVALGHSLGLELVAEGVETAEEAQVLAGLRCHHAQGWHFGRPVPRAVFEQKHLCPIGADAPTPTLEPAPA